jgi:Rrf2 family protein
MIEIARQTRTEESVPVVVISKTLGISKIFLEQTVSQLKKDGLLYSIKGKKGGYQLAREANNITVYDVLAAIESGLLEKAGETVPHQSPSIEATLALRVWETLDDAIEAALQGISIQDLLDQSEQLGNDQAFMMNM